MAGTPEGGKLAAKTNLNRTEMTIEGKTIKINPGEFYSIAGKLGGKASTTGGFYANNELARKAGALGGKNSKRTWSEEQKKAHSERLRETWRLKNAN